MSVDRGWLESVVNISEGRRPELVAAIAGPAGAAVLDVHSDPDHHRSVLTLSGEMAARLVTVEAVRLLDLRDHHGVHPRLGVVDVVPFTPIDLPFDTALRARDEYARWAAAILDLPVFLYGPERSLPEVRRRAWRDLAPDIGPGAPHPTAGAVCVGAREVLVAYNLWLARPDLELARDLARQVRGPTVRALGLAVGGTAQVSMNLIDPDMVGPEQVYDLVAAHTPVARAELVGLVPRRVLERIDPARWEALDLSMDRTIEARAERARTRG